MTHNNIPYKAFILAAGFGTRMRPLTDTIPKPMVKVNGRSLIYRTLDKLRSVGIKDVVVNAHYKADILARHLDEYVAQHPDVHIHLSKEDGILDTGGGVRHALDYFGDQPFFVIAGDNLWSDSEIPALRKLADQWNPDEMDILTLMQPIDDMDQTVGVGDYDLLEDGKVKRSRDKSGQYMWTNIRLNHPRIYKKYGDEPFSFLEIMDHCEQQGRFYAFAHDGEWHHISTPDDVKTVSAYLKTRE